jgi:hypothetical protein
VSPTLQALDYVPDEMTIGVGGIAIIAPQSGEGTTNAEAADWVGSGAAYYIRIKLFLHTVAEEQAQRRMYAFMSRGNALSVWDVLDLTHVDGAYGKAIVLRSHSYGNDEDGSGRLLTNSWDLKVEAA